MSSHFLCLKLQRCYFVIFRGFPRNTRSIGVNSLSTVSGIFAALGVTVIACVPAVTSIPAIAGVLLDPDFFSVSGLPPCC
jgi:hypothetical protein